MLRFAVLIAVLLTAGFVAAADETYTIKLQDFPPEGKPIQVTEGGDLTEVIKVYDVNDNLVQDKKNLKASRNVYVDRTLKAEGKTRTKYQRVYATATEKAGGTEKKLPHDGRTIVYEKIDGKYRLSAAGEPKLGEGELAKLTAEANKDTGEHLRKAMLPGKAVKVGETWALTGKNLAPLMEDFKADLDTVKGEGKLVKAYKKNDQQYGVMEFTIAFTPALEGLMDAKGKLVMTLDAPIDASGTTGAVAMKLKITGVRRVEANNVKYKADVAVDLDSKSERREAK